MPEHHVSRISSWYFYDQQVDGQLAEILRAMREDEGLSFHHMTIELDKRYNIRISEPLAKKFWRERVAPPTPTEA